MDRNCGIYKIENQVNSKVYIGSSNNLNKRLGRHKRELNSGKHHSVHLQRSWDKYGGNSFEFDTLLYCSEENLTFYEGKLIEEYESYKRQFGYNFYREADRSKVPKETIERMSKQQKEWLKDNENPMKGKTHTKKSIERIKNNIGDRSGENHPNNKLSRDDIDEIKFKLENSNMTYGEIGDLFGVVKSVVYKINHNKYWYNGNLKEDN